MVLQSMPAFLQKRNACKSVNNQVSNGISKKSSENLIDEERYIINFTYFLRFLRNNWLKFVSPVQTHPVNPEYPAIFKCNEK